MKKLLIFLCALLALGLAFFGFDEMLKDAKSEGYELGYADGYEKRSSEASDNGYEKAYNEGYLDGYNFGFDYGYDVAAGAVETDGGLTIDLNGNEYDNAIIRGLLKKNVDNEIIKAAKAEHILDDLFEDTSTTHTHQSKPEEYTPETKPYLIRVTKPESGEILSGREYYDSEITVTADTDTDYVVSLKDTQGTEYVCFYVRAGDTVTVGVPGKTLYAYFASGTDWYGFSPGKMFGDSTSYSKDDEPLNFDGYTWEYTLYPVTNGNFTESPSSVDEFF